MRNETRINFKQWEREQFKQADEQFCKKNKATLFSALDLSDESDDEQIYSSTRFTVSPSALVTIEEKVQESNDFLNKINIVHVDEQHGYTVGADDFVGTASTTNTYEYDREPRYLPASNYASDQKTELVAHNAYFCEQTNFDVSFSYSKLDTLATKKNFSEILNKQIMVRRGLDRIAIGFNGTHRAANSNKIENPLLQDVNVGWLQILRERNPNNCLTESLLGSGQIKIGKNLPMSEGYSSIDNLVSDLFYTLMPLRYREASEMIVLTGRGNITNKYISLLDESKDIPTELAAFNLLNESRKIGGLRAVSVPFFPENALMITSLDNLSIYIQNGSNRKMILDNQKRDRIEIYDSVNEAYVIEDINAAVLADNIIFVDE